MEELKGIEFNEKLQKSKYATITYSGDLFKSNSASCYIVYGYNDSWEHTTEQEMIKTEEGFTADIKVLDYDKISFCFRNELYTWDNNDSKNYSSPICEPEATPSFILNENVLVDILSNIYERDIAKIESTKIKDFTVEAERVVPTTIEESIGNVSLEDSLEADLNKVLSDIYEANNSTSVPTSKQSGVTVEKTYDMSDVVDEVLAPIVEHVEQIEEPTGPVYDFIGGEFVEEDSLYNDAQEATVKKDTQSEVNSVVDEVVESIHKPVQASEDLDDEEIKRQVNEIVNTVLDQVIQSEEFKEDDTEELDGATDISNALIVKDEKKFVVSAKQLSSFYIMRKRIRLAFYKLFYAIPKMLKSFYGEDAGNK